MKNGGIGCWIILCFFGVSFPQLLAQDTLFTGLIFDDTAYNAVPVASQYAGVKTNLPVKIDLKPYCPTPKNQGETSSCVGWATGYGALTAYRNIQSNITAPAFVNQRANSALFLYNQIASEENQCRKGAEITEALNLLKKNGNCLYREFDEFVQCPEQPSEALKNGAAIYQIKDYFKLFQISDKVNLKVLKTKQSLADKKPVIIGIKVTPDFWNLQNTDVIWQPKSEATVGRHAMVVVGYDDINKRFELMNSSGTDWGNKGFIWIDYQDYGKLVKYGFQLTLKKEEKNNFPLKANLFFQYPYAYKTDEDGYRLNNDEGCPVYLFRKAKVIKDTNTAIYRLSKENSKVGTNFQLIASQIPIGSYLYVFSSSPTNKITTYFPIGDSPKLISQQDAVLIIPGVCNAIKIAEPGRQYIYVLISKEEQQVFFEKLTLLENKEHIDPEKIKQFLGDKIATPPNMIYQSDVMTGLVNKEEQEATVLLFIVKIDAFN